MVAGWDVEDTACEQTCSVSLSWKSRMSGKSPGARLYFFMTVRNTAGRLSISCFCFFAKPIICFEQGWMMGE